MNNSNNTNIEILLQSLLNHNNKSYAKLAAFLLNYQGDFKDLTINYICNELYISSAIPTRMSQELNLQGFNELKLSLKHNRENLNLSLEKYDNLNLEYYIKDITKSLENSFKLFEQKQINTIVDILNRANKISIYAVGGSYLSSLDFAHKLLRLNLNIFFNADRHVQYYIAKNTSQKDVAIGISYSGSTKEVLKALDISKKNGCYTILITSNLKITSDKYDQIIHIVHDEFTNRFFSITSRTTIISILDIIYINLLNSNKEYFRILNNNKYKEY